MLGKAGGTPAMKKSTVKSEHNSWACGRDTDRRYTKINVKHLLHGSNAPGINRKCAGAEASA